MPFNQIAKLTDTDAPCLEMDWYPIARSGYDILAAGLSNGSIRLINKLGKAEKTIPNAHNGCVTI